MLCCGHKRFSFVEVPLKEGHGPVVILRRHVVLDPPSREVILHARALARGPCQDRWRVLRRRLDKAVRIPIRGVGNQCGGEDPGIHYGPAGACAQKPTVLHNILSAKRLYD